jgi:hypothetical protein
MRGQSDDDHVAGGRKGRCRYWLRAGAAGVPAEAPAAVVPNALAALHVVGRRSFADPPDVDERRVGLRDGHAKRKAGDACRGEDATH